MRNSNVGKPLLWVTAVIALNCAALTTDGRGGKVAQQEHKEQETRLELTNYIDLQYYASLNVGTPPQRVTSIIDTGSFELVVFSSSCDGCGKAGVFDGQRSSTHEVGKLVTQLTYGSGDVEGDLVDDYVSLGHSRAAKQHFWEVHKASMPLLNHARFQSILGIGPPETPAADAWGFVNRAVQDVSKALRASPGRRPSAGNLRQIEGMVISAMEIGSTRTMLSNFRVNTFSMCLGRKPGSNGYFIWNDTLAHERPSLFSRLPVVGRHSWTVKMAGARLRERGPEYAGADGEYHLGCRQSCGAVVDSGTSLLVVPASAITVFHEALQMANLDCDSLHELPTLILTIGAAEFSLPPDAYMAQKRLSVPCRLELSVLQSTATSEVGPLWILGMPFLRQYYTTFDVGDDIGSRALHVAPASSNCTPASPGLALAADRTRPYLRNFDLRSMYLPPLAKKITTESFVRI